MGRKKKKAPSDSERLEELKKKFMEQFHKGEIQMKVGDFLKIIEVQHKLFRENGGEEQFWEIINQIRKEELGDDDD